MANPNKFLTVILGVLGALSAAAIDIYLPSLPTIQTELGSTTGQAQLTLSAFFAGLAIGQLFCGPISDTYGRKKILMSGIIIYCIASILCSLADNMTSLIVARFIQALGAACGGVIARAIVRDLFSLDKAAQAQSIINLAFSATPLLAPSIGGYLLIWFGWRSIFFALCFFGLSCLIALYLRVPETLPIEKRNPLSVPFLLRGYKEILKNPRTVGCILSGALAFSCMFTYFAASPFVYITVFKIPEQHYGLLFGLNVLGLIGANFINVRLVMVKGAFTMLQIGTIILALGGVSLFLTTFLEVGGIFGVIAPLFFVVGSLGFVGPNAMAIALKPFARLAGTTSSVFGFFQMTLGAVMAVVTGLLHDGTAVPMGISILGLSLMSLASFLYFIRPLK